MKAEGVEKFARVIEQNVEQARRFAARIVKVPDVVLSAPVSLKRRLFSAWPPRPCRRSSRTR